MEIATPWAPIKALAHLAGDGDIRPWVNGVWIDSSASELRVVATNGAVMGVYRTEEPSTEAPALLIPTHIIKAAKDAGAFVTLRVDAGNLASLQGMGLQLSWQNKGLALPDWRRCFPRQTTGTAQQFDPELIGRFPKVLKALGHKRTASSVRIAHNHGARGPDAALVTLAGVPHFTGLIQSLRNIEKAPLDVPTSPPAWLFEHTV